MAGRAPNRLGRVAHRIYICSAEGNTGKSTVALGALDTLSRRATRVGVFRPISRSTEERDYVLDLLLAHDGVVPIEYDEAIGVSYDEVHADPDLALATIVQRFKAVEERCDAVVIIGSDFTDVGSPTELGYNARIAANLGAPVLLVLGGRVGQGRGPSERLGHAEARTARRARAADRARHRGARPRARDPPRHRREPGRPRTARRDRRPGRRGRAVGGRRVHRRGHAHCGIRRRVGHPRGPVPRGSIDARRSWRPSTASCTRATPTCSTARRSASWSPRCRWRTCSRGSSRARSSWCLATAARCSSACSPRTRRRRSRRSRASC